MKTEHERFEDAFERIRRYYDRGQPLPPDLADRVMYWKAARSYFLGDDPTIRTDSDVVDRLCDDFEELSEGSAWRHVRDCKRYFASMETVNVEFEKVLLKARISKLEQTTSKDSIRAACHTNLIKLGGFDQPQHSEGGSKTVILNIAFNPALVGAKPVPNLLQTVEKFIGEKARRELMIEDTDFEMLPDDGRQPA
ncbi:hypothetical protein F5984_20540 [Rudanella paleaurantiibacter]|uniref:Uncharacterized protein n=1 Tax=Rudanella paleaurantiibacter TaxID=2614655 RepID=A0A7J5TXI6_9BACT|nr:hypothetical protein [Rudanella paleaurantiibacter]KAB7728136.1 hypothetical protein F5984_20540 [Rudanella paleaurantiibacter]